MTDTSAALSVRLPTLSAVVKDLVRKRWVHKRRSVTDNRAVCVSLSRRGQALAIQIEQRVRQVEAMLPKQDRRASGISPKGNRA
ncbi:MAG: hypothetical protein SGJ26_01740 [Nitrospirota bacterium]|nr:hypothetical protein [Nitrospirota bacterium]